MLKYLPFCKCLNPCVESGMKGRPYSCGLEAALDVLDGKWKALILRSVRRGPCRFGELRRAVAGISEKMLIQNLRELEADGVITRKDFHEIPPRVEYSITPFGSTAVDALVALGEWGRTYIRQIEQLKGREPADLEKQEREWGPTFR